MDADTPRTALDWRRQGLAVGLALGVGPAVSREVADALRDEWGAWPARLTGYATAAVVAVAVYAGVWLAVRRRGRP